MERIISKITAGIVTIDPEPPGVESSTPKKANMATGNNTAYPSRPTREMKRILRYEQPGEEYTNNYAVVCRDEHDLIGGNRHGNADSLDKHHGKNRRETTCGQKFFVLQSAHAAICSPDSTKIRSGGP
jgi:hypothetical protein